MEKERYFQAETEGEQPETKAEEATAAITQLGQTNVPQMDPDTNIHCLTIVGQIEGHIQLPPQNKATKYEHVIPQIVAIEQNPKIEGLLVSFKYGRRRCGSRARHCRNARLALETDCFRCAWRRPFDRRADRCVVQLFVHHRDGDDDDSSDPFDGACHRRAADV